ncbi:hypothetical protein NDU88_001956 [Pleurodeles waltl]|uniref:Uncharacterized protein n=1 Tax=Pleurodeles waltl TaxID=8319 RepID=A0AAV7SCC2_PLEWA|nr:hypothetical protein NDU88_001956 [Pleurodeles waltl]
MGHSPTFQSSFRAHGCPPDRVRNLLSGVSCALRRPAAPRSPHAGQSARGRSPSRCLFRAQVLQLGQVQCPQVSSDKDGALTPALSLLLSAYTREGSLLGPQFPPTASGAPGSAIWTHAAIASAAAPGLPALFLLLSDVHHQAAAFSEGRGRQPPLATVNSASDASADGLGSFASLRPRPTAQCQAAASSRGGAERLSPQRGKQHRPPLAPGLRWGPSRASRRSAAESPHSVSRQPGPVRWEGLIRQAPPELEN